MNLTYAPVKIARSIVLLVTSPVESSLRTQVSGWLLRRVEHADQVAFAAWDGDEPRLETADGALTVNSAAALCAWLAGTKDLPAGETWEFPLACSGGSFALNCSVTRVSNCALVTVTMPQPEIASVPVGGQTLTVIRYPGVSHVIVPAGEMERTGAPAVLQSLGRTLATPRTGLLFWNEGARLLDPLLMSRGAGSPVWCQSSGSAAGALGAYLAGRLGDTVSVKMPGGAMAVTRSGDAVTVTAAAEVGGKRTVELVF